MRTTSNAEVGVNALDVGRTLAGTERTYNQTINNRRASQTATRRLHVGRSAQLSGQGALCYMGQHAIRTQPRTIGMNRSLVGGAGLEPAASCMSSTPA
jgi:hypothetical protein